MPAFTAGHLIRCQMINLLPADSELTANWMQARRRSALATQTHRWRVGARSASGFRPPACQLVLPSTRCPLCGFDRHERHFCSSDRAVGTHFCLFVRRAPLDLVGSDSANTRFATACSRLVPEVEQVPLKLGPIPRGANAEHGPLRPHAGLCPLSDLGSLTVISHSPWCLWAWGVSWGVVVSLPPRASSR